MVPSTSIIEELSRWVLERMDVVLVLPFVTSGICLLVRRILRATFDVRLAIFVTSALSLAFGYWFAFSGTLTPLANLFIITPQALLLLGMVVNVLAVHFFRPARRGPSPWWIVLVAIIGHGWTRMWIYALTA